MIRTKEKFTILDMRRWLNTKPHAKISITDLKQIANTPIGDEYKYKTVTHAKRNLAEFLLKLREGKK